MPSAKSVLASRRGGPSLNLNLSQSTLELPAHKLHRQNSSESTLSSDSGLCSSPGTGFLSVAPSCPSSCSAPSSPIGPKFKLTREFEAYVCRLNQHKTLVSKILSSRFLRRWESHSIALSRHGIKSSGPGGFMQDSIPYEGISEVYATKRWDPHHKFCLRIALHDGSSVLFQAPSSYLRDQWLHSILWSKHVSRFSSDAVNNREKDFGTILRNMKAMVDLSLTTPLQDTSIYQTTLDILCGYLHNIDNANCDDVGGCYGNQVIAVMTPLLERCTPTQPICEYLCKLCDSDLPLVTGQLAPVIERIIKRNTDFGKYPGSRRLVEGYLKALSRLDKHSRRSLGQSPRKRARSRSAERCLDCQYDKVRNTKTGSSLSVMTNYHPGTIHEQCDQDENNLTFQPGSSLSVLDVNAPSASEQHLETPTTYSTLSSDAFRTESQISQQDPHIIAIMSSSGSIINVQLAEEDPSQERKEEVRFDGIPVMLEDEVFKSDELVGKRSTRSCAVEAFTRQMHGDSSACPHPRILPNLVAVCLSAIYRAFSQNKDLKPDCDDPDLVCFVRILQTLAAFDDWRLPLSQILQPIPFPTRFIDISSLFASKMAPVVLQFAEDSRCEVHQCLVGVRQNKNGWLQIYAAGSDSEMYNTLCYTLLNCNCLRKAFLSETFSCCWAVEPLILSSLRHQPVAVKTLAILLEQDLIKSEDTRSAAVAAIQASQVGVRLYEALTAKKQMYIKNNENQPSTCKVKPLGTVTLPPKSNDRDLHLLLCNMSKVHDLAQIHSLSLAFTEVTDKSVEKITQLKGLKKLNLWATKISDIGVETLCYQLKDIEELNLCETPVGARGVEALSSLNKLRVVNLNSTRVTMDAYCKLKERFPDMELCDVRYTDAW